MMMSPQSYKKEIENKTLKQLLKEKEKLIKEMNSLDKNSCFKPSYTTIYTFETKYLEILDELIKNKSIML